MIASTSWIVYGMIPIDGAKYSTVVVLFSEMIRGSLVLNSWMMDISNRNKMVGSSPPKEQNMHAFHSVEHTHNTVHPISASTSS